jgi:hypothetical protein
MYLEELTPLFHYPKCVFLQPVGKVGPLYLQLTNSVQLPQEAQKSRKRLCVQETPDLGLEFLLLYSAAHLNMPADLQNKKPALP